MQKNHRHHHKPTEFKELQIANGKWQPAAPDPTGMNAMAGILNNGSLFRDMTGVEGTQKIAYFFPLLGELEGAGMLGNQQAAQKYAEMAGKLADIGQQYALNKQAMKDGLMTKQQAAENIQKASDKHNRTPGEADAPAVRPLFPQVPLL
jgi:hypothetical protein